MAWRIEFTAEALKQLGKIDHADAQRIRNYLRKRVEPLENPRQLGKPLKAKFAKLWRYRVGPYRVVCELQDRKLMVLVVRIGHRKNVYH